MYRNFHFIVTLEFARPRPADKSPALCTFSFPSSSLGMRLCRKLQLRFFPLVSGIRLENGMRAESFALSRKVAGTKRSRNFSCNGVPKLELGNETS